HDSCLTGASASRGQTGSASHDEPGSAPRQHKRAETSRRPASSRPATGYHKARRGFGGLPVSGPVGDGIIPDVTKGARRGKAYRRSGTGAEDAAAAGDRLRRRLEGLERQPRPRLAFLEGKASGEPFLLWRIDEHYEWLGEVFARDLSRAGRTCERLAV